MKSRLLTTLFSLLCLLPVSRAADAAPASVDDRVRQLLAQMTLEEKVGQLVQYSSRGVLTGPESQTEIVPRLKAGGVGSMLNVFGAAKTRELQKLAVESSRLHIPLLFGLDVVHGCRTIFPIPLGTAASWDLGAIERAERIAAVESAATGLHWTFAPMVDIARDPRWGRIAEGAGEDPFLGSAIARARVRGFQGEQLGAPGTILACAKHFAAYGAAQAGRDYFTTDVTERVLREVYLPPFKAAVEAGVATLMSGFNDLDGTPCSANAFLLDRMLRGEWGFRGFVVSDWQSISEMLAHGNVPNLREAARQSFVAGLDVDMEAQAYEKHLAELVRSGVVTTARLDAAVGAVLAAKFRLGLFDDPYRNCDEAKEMATLYSPAHLDAARDMVRRSTVLLKNNGVLPLQAGALTVAVVGPLADSAGDQLGCWGGLGQKKEAITLRSALSEVFPGARLRFAPGCLTTGSDTSGFAAAKAAAAGADVIIAALGESADQSGECTSRASLDLSGPQLALLRELHATGKPVILVLMAGRPLLLEEADPLVDAIVVGWHPGTMGGPGLVDVLTGAYNPSARLPVTWPRNVGQIPLFYAHKNTGRPAPKDKKDRYYTHYIDAPNSPRYAFGFGLSYTTFAYDSLRLSATTIADNSPGLTVTVRVRNTGQRAGEETVQLYVRDRVGSVTRPVRELKGFAKVPLAAGEAKDVSFQLRPVDLAFWRADLSYGTEPGAFDVFVGGDSDATLTASFELTQAPRTSGSGQ